MKIKIRLMARKGPLSIIAHKEHDNNYKFFDIGINLGSIVQFEVIGSKALQRDFWVRNPFDRRGTLRRSLNKFT